LNKYKFYHNKLILGIGDGDWGLGIGDWAQSPIPNPQSPIPKNNLILLKIYSSDIFFDFNKIK
jgi:hypothetical protein